MKRDLREGIQAENSVMAGLGPATHEKKLVDPRAKPGDDGIGNLRVGL